MKFSDFDQDIRNHRHLHRGYVTEADTSNAAGGCVECTWTNCARGLADYSVACALSGRYVERWWCGCVSCTRTNDAQSLADCPAVFTLSGRRRYFEF